MNGNARHDALISYAHMTPGGRLVANPEAEKSDFELDQSVEPGLTPLELEGRVDNSLSILARIATKQRYASVAFLDEL
jgi:hypothetical protein